MREIKFKAWDKINKKWLNLWKILIATEGEIMAIITIDGEQYGLHQVTLVEFTGLHDKNGKEIFEGDILGVEYNPIAIKWDEARGGWGSVDRSYAQCFEILGNVYENPDLIY